MKLYAINFDCLARQQRNVFPMTDKWALFILLLRVTIIKPIYVSRKKEKKNLIIYSALVTGLIIYTRPKVF